MATRILRTQSDIDGLARFLASNPLPVTVSVTKGAKRSTQQNRTAAMWYGQIGQECGDTQGAVKAQCKLRFGVPILERDNPAWVENWRDIYTPLPYTAKLRLFEYLPVTSVFTTKQMSEYMDAVQREYRSQGIDLIDPEARKYEAFV